MKTPKNLVRSACCGLVLLANTADSKWSDVPEHLYQQVLQFFGQSYTRQIDLLPVPKTYETPHPYKALQEWVDFFNYQGKAMISAPDVYKAASQEVVLLESLREDIIGIPYGLTSTVISYNPNDLGAKVTHDFGSTVVKPKEIIVPKVPVCRPCWAESFIGTDSAPGKGLPYVQAIFDTKDKPSQILKTLEKLSEESRKRVAFITEEENGMRRLYNTMPVVFSLETWRGWTVYGDASYTGWTCYFHSRGVSLVKERHN